MGKAIWKTVQILVKLVLLVNVVVAEEKVEEKQEERLGLLASTLGVQPVPGYTPEGGVASGGGGGLALIGGGGKDYENIQPVGGGGGIPPYKASSGFQGGNGPCQCVPVEHCSTSGGPGPYPGGDKQPVIVEPIPDKQPGPGYGPGDDDHPPKDGAGIIDIRIVNRVSVLKSLESVPH